MNTIQILQVIQMVLALTVGIYIGYRLKGGIRKVITQLMPVKQRVSDDFFNILTFRSTITSIATIAILSGLAYWGLEKIKQQWLPASILTEEQSAPKAPSLDKAPKVEVQKPTDPSTPNNEQPVENTQPKTATKPQLVYFLQTDAFKHQHNAVKRYHHHRKRFGNQVRLIRHESYPPYRIWIGPFPTSAAVRKFKRQHGLPGHSVEQVE